MTDTATNQPTTWFVPSGAYQQLPKQPQPWVVEKLIPMGGLVNLYGKPKTGKSFLALSLAQAIVNQEPDWCGYPIPAPGPVAYLQIDTPREEWSSRLSKMSIKPVANSDLWIADMWQVPEFPFNILNPNRRSCDGSSKVSLQSTQSLQSSIRYARFTAATKTTPPTCGT